MNNGVSQDMLNTILGDVLSLCRQTFETRLVSVVLFGSYAQGTASPGSDIDLLVIVQQLPADPEPQEKLLDSIEIPILKKYHRCVFCHPRNPGSCTE
jgi:predicted nucleotidyltransferase